MSRYLWVSVSDLKRVILILTPVHRIYRSCTYLDLSLYVQPLHQ
jgi:hypothetical protein